MSATPGSLTRYMDGAWLHQGSYILAVSTQAALPPAPVTDDVFAFTHDARELWVSQGGTWVKFSGGGGGAAVTECSARAVIGPSGAAVAGITKLPLNAVTWDTHNGFDLAADQYVVKSAGTYGVYGNALFSAHPTNARVLISAYKNGVEFAHGTDETYTSSAATTHAAHLYGQTQCQVGDVIDWRYMGSTAATVASAAGYTYVGVYQIGGTRGPPGPTFPYRDYTEVDGLVGWSAGFDVINSVYSAAVINDRWVQCYAQAVASGTFATGNQNISIATVVPALRPTLPAVQSFGLLYPSYQSCRVTVSPNGVMNFIHLNVPAGQTQVWANLGYPLYT